MLTSNYYRNTSFLIVFPTTTQKTICGHEIWHQMVCWSCPFSPHHTVSQIQDHCVHPNWRGAWNIAGTCTLRRRSKGREDRVPLAIDWQWRKSSVHEPWTEERRWFIGYMVNLSTFSGESSNWSRCDFIKNHQWHYEDVAISTQILICNVWFMFNY